MSCWNRQAVVWFCTITNMLLSNVKEKLNFPKEAISNFGISDDIKFWFGTNTIYSSLWPKCCVSKCWTKTAEKQALVEFCSGSIFQDHGIQADMGHAMALCSSVMMSTSCSAVQAWIKVWPSHQHIRILLFKTYKA